MHSKNEPGEIWEISNSGYLYIEQVVIDTISSFKQIPIKSDEAGGLLIGHFKPPHLHITNLTTPMPKDKASRTQYCREDPGHVKRLKSLYNLSSGKLNLIGEWHTHPERTPTPSSIDLNQWRKLQKKWPGQVTIFLILGTTGFWVGDGSGKQFRQLD